MSRESVRAEDAHTRRQAGGSPHARSRPGVTFATALAVLAAILGALLPRGASRESAAVRRAQGPDAGSLLELAPPLDSSGFSRATAPREFRLPADHGPHFGFQTEWWYFTGVLAAGDGRRFGFQLTFFRRGLSPGPPPDGPGLSTNQLYFAHFAVSDEDAGEHAFAERWARGAGGLAGATGEPFAVWLEGWRAEATDADGRTLRLAAGDGPRRIELDLESRKPLVRHGDRGVSAKSDEPGNASYYVGYTRLGVRGRLATERGETAVTGEAWFDHEWSTSALGPGAVGWDWFSLQLSDGRDLMYFQIRRTGGGIEPASGGTLVSEDGATQRLSAHEVELSVLARWTSPHTSARYPARWRLRVPEAGLDLVIAPLVGDQEMRTSFLYWEGAVTLSGRASGGPIAGHGYVELTGYAASMQGVF